MSDKPIDLVRRRKLLTRMAQLEKGMRELRKELATPEQLQKLAHGEVQSIEKHFARMRKSFELATPWLLEMMTLQGAILKLSGHDPHPSDALAMVAKCTDFCTDSFKAAVTARIAKLEEELIA